MHATPSATRGYAANLSIEDAEFFPLLEALRVSARLLVQAGEHDHDDTITALRTALFAAAPEREAISL